MRGYKGLIGLLGVDPGVTTGLAWGVFDLSLETIGDTLRCGEGVGWKEVVGSDPWQARVITGMFEELRDRCSSQLLPCEMIIEDFILRPGRASADRAQLAPVRITSCIEGMMTARALGIDAHIDRDGWEFMQREALGSVVKQTPAAAKTYATKERLTRWGAWKPGMRHSRDAWRHIALRLATVGRS